MEKHSVSFKVKAVEQALQRSAEETLSQCAARNGIGYSTLTNWMAQARQGKLTVTDTVVQEKRPRDWSAAEKLQAVIEIAALNEEDKGRYCRQNGVFGPQLTQWKQEMMRSPNEQTPVLKAENRALKEELKQVRRELAHKEKALAEAAALLILKKKPKRCSVRTRTINDRGAPTRDHGPDRFRVYCRCAQGGGLRTPGPVRAHGSNAGTHPLHAAMDVTACRARRTTRCVRLSVRRCCRP